jgi:hypothetical protein
VFSLARRWPLYFPWIVVQVHGNTDLFRFPQPGLVNFNNQIVGDDLFVMYRLVDIYDRVTGNITATFFGVSLLSLVAAVIALTMKQVTIIPEL